MNYAFEKYVFLKATWRLDIDKFLVTKLDPPHKNIGIELPLGQILKRSVASESRTSLANMAILTKI